MRIFMSILAFIISLAVIKMAIAFTVLMTIGNGSVDGGGQLLINIVAYGLAIVAARFVYERMPKGTPKAPVRYATKEEAEALFSAQARGKISRPWLNE
ncbi:hypothetical protein [Brucella sp. 10RB9210]|uniref:hypothetical protein n=1 Tax=Brucella sp. 10RB9210 TaxID=1844037 RepID=UPI0012AE23F3|nr:hypothetical protein [Brucella sp. 10RB9210]MRN79448.1 hypothetical protein [Brucella sp. 10RB9210]